MSYTQVKNPKWANAEKTLIDCEVNFDHLSDGFVPFTASLNDSEEYSKDIYSRCEAGEFGIIGDYVAPIFTINPDDAIVTLTLTQAEKNKLLALLNE